MANGLCRGTESSKEADKDDKFETDALADYNSLYAYSTKDLTNDTLYNEVCEKMDLDNFLHITRLKHISAMRTGHRIIQKSTGIMQREPMQKILLQTSGDSEDSDIEESNTDKDSDTDKDSSLKKRC